VRIVERKDSGLTFALKYIRKDEGIAPARPPARFTYSLTRPSRTPGKRAKHHPRATHARTPQPPFPLQPAIQLPGLGVPVRGARLSRFQQTTHASFHRYLVVDLMSGGDLRFHITRKTFTEDAVRFWIAELGCALRYVHQQGIVHRDVKPDNVLLDSEGHVHLADFVSWTGNRGQKTSRSSVSSL